jgi:hypothetical protein
VYASARRARHVMVQHGLISCFLAEACITAGAFAGASHVPAHVIRPCCTVCRVVSCGHVGGVLTNQRAFKAVETGLHNAAV